LLTQVRGEFIELHPLTDQVDGIPGVRGAENAKKGDDALVPD
jgi:hypothetical protein